MRIPNTDNWDLPKYEQWFYCVLACEWEECVDTVVLSCNDIEKLSWEDHLLGKTSSLGNSECPLSLESEIIMQSLNGLVSKVIEFRDERDWKQFHNPKDLALALSIEAAELNELFLWRNSADVDKEMVKQELADVFNYAFLILNHYGFDLEEIVEEKLKINSENYPVEKAKGNAKKHH